MNTLLIFFAFPIAVIIISAIMQKVLKNPIAVASLVFAIFLIVTFAVFDETFLIATLIYTIIAFITALIINFICQINNSETNLNTVSNLVNNNNSNCNNSCICNRYRRFR